MQTYASADPEMQTVGRSLLSACHRRRGAEWRHDAQSV